MVGTEILFFIDPIAKGEGFDKTVSVKKMNHIYHITNRIYIYR